MCGRILLTTPQQDVRRLFGFLDRPNLAPRYNVAPGQAVAAMLRDAAAQRRFVWLRWGLVPAWAQGPQGQAPREQGGQGGGRPGAPLINARGETLADKPSFREAFARRRCVVFADGFYEWRQDGNRQPYCVRLAGGGPFAIAALWEPVIGPGPGDAGPGDAGPGGAETGEPPRSCALVTTAANAAMAAVHHRMPVILAPEQVGPWLDPASPRRDLQALLAPLPEGALTLTPVSKRVNAVREDDPDLLREERLPEIPAQLALF